MNALKEILVLFIQPTVTLAVLVVTLILIHLFLQRQFREKPEKMLSQQLIMSGLTCVAAVAFIISLPVSDAVRGQILALVGIVLSAAIALSSTTFLGNAIAGIMLRAVRSFRVGDFIHINEHFGRVSARGLFHIEIQTVDRDLTTLPNLYIATNPVKVIRTSGTIISEQLSLGYDIPRTRIEELLIDAAKQTGLEEPFVHVKELGDFSVVYRISGLLTDVGQILSSHSKLNEKIMDNLHKASVEIVSPTFMNTRAAADKRFIPEPEKEQRDEKPETKPEDIVFDKAQQAEELELNKKRLNEMKKQIEEIRERIHATEDEKEKEELEGKIAQFEIQGENLKSLIEKMHEQMLKKEELTRER